jgi:hypothetical protein
MTSTGRGIVSRAVAVAALARLPGSFADKVIGIERLAAGHR